MSVKWFEMKSLPGSRRLNIFNISPCAVIGHRSIPAALTTVSNLAYAAVYSTALARHPDEELLHRQPVDNGRYDQGNQESTGHDRLGCWCPGGDCLAGFLTSLSLGLRSFLAVLAGALMDFVTYAKQRGPGQDAVRRAALTTAAIGLLCFVGLVLVALG